MLCLSLRQDEIRHSCAESTGTPSFVLRRSLCRNASLGQIHCGMSENAYVLVMKSVHQYIQFWPSNTDFGEYKTQATRHPLVFKYLQEYKSMNIVQLIHSTSAEIC